MDIVKLLEEFTTQGPNLTSKPDMLGPGPQEWILIDQIFIEHNLKERASQVSIMDQIYDARSSRLPGLERTTNIRKWLFKVFSSTIWRTEILREAILYPMPATRKGSMPRETFPPSLVRMGSACCALSTPYFRRLWVVQEIILSKWIVGYCGNRDVHWEVLCRLAHDIFARQLYLDHPTSTVYIDPMKAVVAIENELVTMIAWREHFIKGDKVLDPKQFSLLALITDTWTFKAAILGTRYTASMGF